MQLPDSQLARDFFDLESYPIDRPESTGARELVRRSRRRFADDGVVTLPGFLRPSAVAAIADEANELADQAFYCESEHNVYLDAGDPGLPSSHPRNRRLKTHVGSIANDYLDPDGVLQRLYDWPCLTSFIGSVLELESIHQGADPLGAVSINVYGEGDGHGWHFDESRFSVTIMIQEPAGGGRFDYVSGLRSDAEDSDEVTIASVLDGAESAVQQLTFSAGTLLIIGGRHTMHRVTPVVGSRLRLVPVLTYDTSPGAVNSPEVQRLFWGRTLSTANG